MERSRRSGNTLITRPVEVIGNSRKLKVSSAFQSMISVAGYPNAVILKPTGDASNSRPTRLHVCLSAASSPGLTLSSANEQAARRIASTQ
jgi:hypothetical protein